MLGPVPERVAWAVVTPLTQSLGATRAMRLGGLAGTRAGARLAPLLVVSAGAVVLRAISGVAFANYDTLYALAWGG